MMRRLLIPTLLLSTACVITHGKRPQDFPPANGPEGARITLRVVGESAQYSGELLAVDSVGITLRGGRITLVTWAKVEAVDVLDAGSEVDIQIGQVVTPQHRARLALLSRFPQGMKGLPITLDTLIAEASRETMRFVERRVAVDEGFRRVGADFPGMGEHWLNVGTLLRNTVDPANPALLTYATIAERPTLLGVGFVIVTHADTAPRGIPGWPTEWHEHSGLLADESAAVVRRSRPDPSTHVWVMHVWTRLANPAGAFAADNWSLPFVRAGLPAPEHADPDGGRAMSLAVGGDEFLRNALTDADLRVPHNAAAVDSAIAAARLRVTSSVHDRAHIQALGEIWNDLASSLERTVGPSVRQIISSHSERHTRRHP